MMAVDLDSRNQMMLAYSAARALRRQMRGAQELGRRPCTSARTGTRLPADGAARAPRAWSRVARVAGGVVTDGRGHEWRRSPRARSRDGAVTEGVVTDGLAVAEEAG